MDGAPRGPRGGVTTVGSGTAEVSPDVARVRLGATARHEQPATALREASGSLDAIRRALLEFGVEPRDLRTAATSSWTEGGEVVDVPGGGQVTRRERTTVQLTLEVAVRDLARTADCVAAALAAGGDAARLEGTSFEVSETEDARRTARGIAFRRAVAAAAQIAELAGRELGQVLDVRETADGAPPVGPYLDRAMSLEAGGPAFDPGSSTVRVDLVVRHAWAPPVV